MGSPSFCVISCVLLILLSSDCGGAGNELKRVDANESAYELNVTDSLVSKAAEAHFSRSQTLFGTREQVLDEYRRKDADITTSNAMGISIDEQQAHDSKSSDVASVQQPADSPAAPREAASHAPSAASELPSAVHVKGVPINSNQLAGLGVNHAAFDLASKAIVTNPLAKGESALLKNDRDKYWISPCKVEPGVKFVVIELGELIRIHTIVLGSFEYYSSTVKHFQVLGALNYPTGEWDVLGNFYALPARQYQAFHIPLTKQCKYLKIQFLSQYGNEFYCTLSSVKVYGFTQWDLPSPRRLSEN